MDDRGVSPCSHGQTFLDSTTCTSHESGRNTTTHPEIKKHFDMHIVIEHSLNAFELPNLTDRVTQRCSDHLVRE